MASELQAVVFDVDGTLVDSERDGHRVAFNLAFEELGLPYRWDPEPYGALLRIAGGEQRLAAYLEEREVDDHHELARRLHERKTELFQSLIEEGRVGPRPGVRALLDELADAAVPVAVATTGSRAWVEPLLDRLFGLSRFAAVVTGDEAPIRKPDPSAYQQVVAALGLTAGRRIVAVEDSRNGLVAAKGAALSCVVVVNDYTCGDGFPEADVVVQGFGGDEPATPIHDPRQVMTGTRLDLAVLRRVIASA